MITNNYLLACGFHSYESQISLVQFSVASGIAVYFENHIESKNTNYGQHAEIFDVEVCGTYKLPQCFKDLHFR
jgi:hypothetical protein